jgi:sulfur-oxidizing protein SoxZ
MADPMRIRAQENAGVVDVKILMKHDMETGQRKDASGKIVPTHHITVVTASCKGKQIFEGHFGAAVSKDPFLNFKFKGGAKGDVIAVTWVDNKGDKRTDETKIG